MESVLNILEFIQSNGICRTIKENHMKILEKCTSLDEIKIDLTHFHQDLTKMKKKHKRTHSDF